ncbi:MAG: DNA repair protein RecO [Gaiellaceae bacterium]
MARPTKTQAVVLRSIRFGEADRVLHLYTLDRGRIGAIGKGVRKTMSRFGARLEPLSHVEIMLHRGRGELFTVTGVELLRSHHETREDPYRLGVALVGAEAMLRLFAEPEGNARAFEAVTRFLDLTDALEPGRAARPAHDPLALSFQLKLLTVSGYLPHLESCAECGETTGLVGYSPQAGGAVCGACANGARRLGPATFAAIGELLRRPLAEAAGAGVGEREARETLALVTASYEFHGGFRLRTLS